MSKKYALQDLLKVRELREEAASKAVAKAQDKLKACEQYLEKKRKELADYKEWRPQEEKRMYDKIMKKEISQEKLREVKADIAVLRDREVAIEKEVEEAEVAVQEAEQGLQKAKDDHKASMRELEKIKEHKDIWIEEAKKEEEFAMDKELEEFRKHEIE